MRAITAIAVLAEMIMLSAVCVGADPPDEFYKVLPSKARSGKMPLPRLQNQKRDNAAAADSKDAETHTTINIELLTGDEGVGLRAQEWQQIFQKFDCAVQIRTALPTDKVQTREKKVSRIRQIFIVGRLDPSGRLVFQDRAFSPSETAALGEWIRELKTYGAQGSPEGKPLWGLNEQQFEELFKEFGAIVSEETSGLALDKALAVLAPSKRFPLEQKVSARKRLAESHAVAPVAHELKGFARGTALAVVLAEYGLGFRPLRTPQGSIELAVESLDRTNDAWPAGWDLPENTRPPAVVPKLYQLVPVEFAERPLPEALKSVSDQTGLTILHDDWRIRSKGIKVDEIRVKHSPKQTTFDLVLGRITTPHLLLYRLRLDETGRPFVWITTLEPGRLSR